MQDFKYHRPKTAKDITAVYKKDAALMAGGMTLLPTMKQSLAAPSAIVDLGAVKTMKGIKVTSKAVSIGAMVTHADVAASADVAKAIPALAKLAEGIGDRQVRNCGTIGGSIANNDPAADYPAAALALNAVIHTDKRKIEADKFFKGMFETALKNGEVVTKIEFPIPRKAGYAKFPNPASRYALVGVMIAEFKGGCRVAVTGAGMDGVYRQSAMEKALGAMIHDGDLDGVTESADNMNSDIHASADYRAHMVGVMAKRAAAGAS